MWTEEVVLEDELVLSKKWCFAIDKHRSVLKILKTFCVQKENILF